MRTHVCARHTLQVGELNGRAIELGIREGLVGWVASTASPINVRDARRDARHSDAADARAGMRTRSAIAWPVLDEDGEHVLAVLLLVNKRGGEKCFGAFSKDDEAALKLTAVSP